MSDPLATHHRHRGLIGREELRQFIPTPPAHYVDTPQLIVPHVDAVAPFDWDTAAAIVVGDEVTPTWAAPYWTLPAGVWTARLHVSGSVVPPFVGWRARVRVRLLADAAAGAADPTHVFVQDLTTTYDGQTELAAHEIRGQVESAPLTGPISLWADAVSLIGSGAVTLSHLTRIVFGRLA